MDSKEIVKAVVGLAGIEDAQRLQEALGRQPGLLGPEVDGLLTRAIREEGRNAQTDWRLVYTLLTVRATLAGCRAQGEQITLPQDLVLPLTHACPLPDLARLRGAAAYAPEREAQWRRALGQLRRETEPGMWASTSFGLARTLARTEGARRAAGLREAAGHLAAALEVWREQQMQDEWAETLSELVVVREQYALLDPAAHVGEAIGSNEEKLEEIDPAQHPEVRGRVLHSLGNLYCQWLGGERAENLDRAKIYYEVALCIRDRTRQENPKPWAYTRLGLSNAYLWRVRGDPAQNIEQAIEGYRAAQEAMPPESSGETWAEVAYNLAVAYRLRRQEPRQENIEQAIQHARDALAFFSKRSLPRQTATVRSELAILYGQRTNGNRRQNLELMIGAFESALTDLTPEKTPAQWARAHDGLGNALMDRLEGNSQENVERAIGHYLQALEIRTREQYPKEWAETKNNLGTAHATRWAWGRSPAGIEAVRCYRDALEVRKPDTLPAGARQTARNLGQLYFHLGQWSLARDAFAIALEAAQTLYTASFSRPGKGAELAENAALYPDAAYTAARLKDPEGALRILEQGKTRLLAEALRLRVPRPARVGSGTWQAFKEAARGVGATEMPGATPLGGDLEAVQAASQQEQAAREAQDTLARAIVRVRAEAPDFLQDLDAAALRSRLPDDGTALVAFCITHRGSIGLLVHRWQQDAVQMVDVPAFTKGTLDGLLFGTDGKGNLGSGWVGEYQRHNHDPEKWKPCMEQVLDEVGQKLLAPILKSVPPNIDHLIFLPSGGLYLLPLHAAPLAHDEPGCVRDKFQVTYAPSAKVLASLPALGIPARRHGLIASVSRPDAASCPGAKTLKFAPLEGIVIGRLLRHCLHLEDAKAKRQAFVRGARERAYVHFAGHGEYEWDDPPQSGLWLHDEKLTLADLERGHLAGAEGEKVALSAARLVTLSACETGIADVIQGSADEYLSLPAGFIRAGVPCVVSSLWQVKDLSALLLMERFYRNHLQDRMAPGLALHEAQAWMCHRLTQKVVLDTIDRWQGLCKEASRDDLNQNLEEARATLTSRVGHDPGTLPYTHPFYWAAFTVTGR